jgi:hypothetical protein
VGLKVTREWKIDRNGWENCGKTFEIFFVNRDQQIISLMKAGVG